MVFYSDIFSATLQSSIPLGFAFVFILTAFGFGFFELSFNQNKSLSTFSAEWVTLKRRLGFPVLQFIQYLDFYIIRIL